MRFLLPLLACFSCCAQLPVVPLPQLVLASASVFNPTNIATGAKYWWVSSDITTNTTVTNWIDRIQSSIWTNGNSSVRPTNSSLGVHFVAASSLQLTNTSVSMSGPVGDVNTFWCVVSLDSGPTFMDLMVISPSLNTADYGFNSTKPFWHQSGVFVTDSAIPTSHYTDIAFTSTSGSGHTSPAMVIYTNGVQSLTSTATSVDVSTTFKALGGNSGNGFFDGYVRELLIYTNTLSSVEVSNLHYYSTNLYKYSP